MKILLALVVSIFPSIALASPITFDLRDPAIELIDEANSFYLPQGGRTLSLSATSSTSERMAEMQKHGGPTKSRGNATTIVTRGKK